MNFIPLDDSDPVVQLFEKETATANLARELMDQHGLQDWKFEYSNDINTMGWCSRKTKTIQLSKRYLHHHLDELKDTILHEIAHALVSSYRKGRIWVHHGPEWRAKARELGARPETCAENHVTPIAPPKKFYLECSGCGKRWYRHRLKRKMIGRLSSCCRQPLKGYRIK